MPLFGFSRTLSLKHKKNKNNDGKLKKSNDLLLQRTASCPVTGLPQVDVDTDHSKIINVSKSEEDIPEGKLNFFGGIDVSDTKNTKGDLLSPQSNDCTRKETGEEFVEATNDDWLVIDERKQSRNEIEAGKAPESSPRDHNNTILKPVDEDCTEIGDVTKNCLRDRRRKIPVTTINRRSQHFEDHPVDVFGKTRNRQSRNFEEDIEKSRKARWLSFLFFFFFDSSS